MIATQNPDGGDANTRRIAYGFDMNRDWVVRTQPEADSLWFSGYAAGADSLLGSAGLVDERLGAGHVVLFSGEPNFRAWTDGTQFLLANTLIYPKEPAARVFTDVRSEAAATALAQRLGRPVRRPAATHPHPGDGGAGGCGDASCTELYD